MLKWLRERAKRKAAMKLFKERTPAFEITWWGDTGFSGSSSFSAAKMADAAPEGFDGLATLSEENVE